MSESKNTWLTLLMIAGMATWGLSWTNGKVLGTYAEPLVLMFWRFLIAALAMLMVLGLRKLSLRLQGRQLVSLLAASLLLVVYNYAYFRGTHAGAAGAGGVLVTTLNPILTVILVAALRRTRPERRILGGIVMGMLGGTFLMDLWQGGLSALLDAGNIYFLICASSWAVLTVISTRVNAELHTLTFSFYLYLFSAAFTLPLVRGGGLLTVFQYDYIFWINLGAISLGAMAFATTAYFVAADSLGAEKAAAFIFMVPLTAMLFSMLFLHETLHLHVAIGGLLSIAAVYLINSSRKLRTARDSFSEYS